MAKCDLTIELEDPDRAYQGGDRVRGTIIVRTDKKVHCSNLELTLGWETHGRGNIARATPIQQSVYRGEWQPGEHRYAFDLETAGWPPTYHGHYLNVDHYVRARAKIPWAFDPKTEIPIRVIPTGDPNAIPPAEPNQMSNVIGFLVAALLVGTLIGFSVAFVFNPFVLAIFGGLALVGSGYWFCFKWLPKWKLGQVNFHVDQQQLAAGEALTGNLSIQPRGNLAINQISMTLSAQERCVSGSGSNRRTHRHILFEITEMIATTSTVAAGKPAAYPFHLQLPDNAAPTLMLNDNQLLWSLQATVDIPRWPDWKEKKSVTVVPRQNHEVDPAKSGAAETVAPQISFAETAKLIWTVRDDPDQVERVVSAVIGLQMEFPCVILRRRLADDLPTKHAYPDGTIVQARFSHPELPLTLYAPSERTEEFHEQAGETWQGRGTVVGFDYESQSLQIRIPAEASDRRP